MNIHNTQRWLNGDLLLVYEDYARPHCYAFGALCLDSLQISQLQSYSSAIVVSVTYYKQHIFREKAVIV